MKVKMDRRQVLLGLGAASALTLSGKTALAVDEPTVRAQLGWLKTVEFGGFWLADDRGYYKEAGVNPQWLAGGPSIASTPPIVAGGQADMGIDQFLTAVEAIALGSELVVIGSVFQETPSGLLSLPTNPITKPEDLVGKRIGVQGSSTEFIDALFKINKLPIEYTPVPVGFDPTPLLEGACDAFVCFVTNQPIAFKLKGIPYVVTTYGQLGMPGYADTLYVSRSFLQENRPALVKFLRASLRGWQDYLVDIDAAVKVTLSNYGSALGLDGTQQREQAIAQTPLIKPSAGIPLLGMSMDLISGPIYESFRLIGHENLPDPRTVVDLSLLEEAHAGL